MARKLSWLTMTYWLTYQTAKTIIRSKYEWELSEDEITGLTNQATW
jgi:hypothetical protein